MVACCILEKYFCEIIATRPEWQKEKITINKIELGMTNTNYRVSCDSESIFLRLYGENVTATQLEKDIKISKEFGAEILCTFPGGRIEEWIKGRPFTHKDLSGDTIKTIASMLARFHIMVGLNHNDLSFVNILISDHNKIDLIDFEFAGKLNIYYDIANFFCEWMYDYESDDWYMYDLSLFPSYDQINIFCNAYIKSSHTPDMVCEDFINRIFDTMDAVHEFWVNWAEQTSKGDSKITSYGEARSELIGRDLKQVSLDNDNVRISR